MALFSLQNVRIAGVTTAVPKRIISNIEDCPPQLVKERERLVRNIGILNRRIMRDQECFSDLALISSEQIISELNWKKDEIDAFIVITQSPDYLLPSEDYFQHLDIVEVQFEFDPFRNNQMIYAAQAE